MGYLIVTVVGAILGWLAAIVADRDYLATSIAAAFVGAIGAVVAALLSGSVPLEDGVSAMQLVWAVVGAGVAIAITNGVAMRYSRPASPETINNPADRRNNRPRPFYQGEMP